MDSKFIVIVATSDKENNMLANAVLFDSFDEAIAYARSDAKNYKHLASSYEEHVGVNKRHATIKLKGMFINKLYRISNLGTTSFKQVLDSHPNTYSDWDYLHDDTAI